MFSAQVFRSRDNLLTLPSTQDFLSRKWKDPAETLDRSIKSAADALFFAPSSVAEQWLHGGKQAMNTAVLVDINILPSNDAEQWAYLKDNVKALEGLVEKYGLLLETTETSAESQKPMLSDEQKDIGFNTVEQGGHDTVQSMQLDTLVLINDELVGDPVEHSRTYICPPAAEEENKLIFQASYLFPEHDYTYIVITVARWSRNWNEGLALKTLGTIEVPMAACRKKEPKLEVITAAEAGKLVGVEACSCRAARYTVIGTPRFYYAEYTAGLPQDNIPEGLSEIASLIDGKSLVSLSLLHPMRSQMVDVTQDFTCKILESCTQGWHRDGGKPWDVYYANSRFKSIFDLGTVPKGHAIPFLDQVPARDTFDHREQYTIRMAVGNQQEREFHDRHHIKLRDCQVPIRLIADPRSLHPVSKAPQHYFAIVDTSAAGPNVDYLLPRDGDRAYFVMLGVFANNRAARPEDMGEIDNEHIAVYITDLVRDVRNDSSIESKPALYEKLQDMLKVLCVRDENGDDIPENIKTLQDKLEEIRELAKNDEKLLKFVKANRTWLAPPPPEIDEDSNPFTDPIRLRGYRVNVPSKLWSPFSHLWKLTVPVDKNSGPAKLPLVLDVRDASFDDAGKLLTLRAFTELANSGEANLNIKMEVIDSDKTHNAEMTALKKLSAPHTMPEDDRPSVASLVLFNDVVKADLRDTKPVKHLMVNMELLRQGKHDDEDLQSFYKDLSKDKHKAIEYFLDSKKLIKYFHGPPGTGKSHLALFIACIAVMFSPPTDDDWDRPVDLERQFQPEEFDKVDQTAPLRPIPLSDAQKAATSETPRTKVLIVSGQNNPVDDLFRRFRPMWDSLGGGKGGKYQPKAVRLYSWKSESKEFARRFANIGPHIQRTVDDESTGGILMQLLNGFSDKVDELDREHQRTRNLSDSIVDMAVKLFKKERENGKYAELSYLIDQVSAKPDQIYLHREEISRLVQSGPQKDALAQADIVFATPVGVAEKNFRETFRPHYIFSDENPRDKEITTLILLAHFSPKAYLFFGDHNQLAPIIFSTYQHRKYKAPRAFQPVQQEESLPKPATFALQLARPMISRLVAAGFPCVMLTQNHRQHGTVGDFFSTQFYHGKVEFSVKDDRFSLVDKAAIKWLIKLSGKENMKGNTLMIDMNSREISKARSFSNVEHVNFVLAHVADLLGNHKFRPSKSKPEDGKVMIIVPYEAQKKLYENELQKRAAKERNVKGDEWVDFPKDQIEIRTHQGAQGHEASVVIIDLVRSDSPGHTSHDELVNVCSSRAICAQLVLVNTSVFNHKSWKSPHVRSLTAWIESHKKKDTFISIDGQTAKQWRITCFKCYGFGHKGDACKYTTTKEILICPKPGCGRKHHPRDCYKRDKNRDPVVSTGKALGPVEPTEKAQAPATTSQQSAAPAIPTTRSEQAKKMLKANRAMKKAARKFAKNENYE